MRILHLSADYPDPLAPAKTKAVRNLLELAEEHEHRVFSLNRIGGAGVRALDFADGCGERQLAVAYGAPPKGLFMSSRLRKLADWIGDRVEASGFAPELIHAHKLSVEGLVGSRLAERFGAPLAISIQGNTDLKIVGARRDLRAAYSAIWREAAVVFPFAPWAEAGLEALLGRREKPTRLLPCPGPAEAMLAPRVVGPVFRAAFNLKDARNKNAAGLIQAVAEAAKQVPEIRLEIIGGGDAAAFAELDTLAEQVAPDRITFLGAVPNDRIQPLFNASCALPMVSHRESFGMVFTEALLAGAPCLISRGRGIDGYFEEGSVVVAADPKNGAEIAEGLVRLARDEAAFKERLARLADSGGLDFLRRSAIVETYRGGLNEAVGQAAA